jgi:uncharacterized protein (TIGR03437 family)
MKRTMITIALWPALALSAQTSQTALFRAVTTTGVFAPSPDTGVADLLVHVVKDSSGNILSGSADFDLAYQFPNDEAVTGLGITGSAGGASFLLATNISATAPVLATAGSGRISSQVQVAAGNQAGLAVLNGLFANPGQYSIDVITVDHPAGAMSGPFQAGNATVLMAVVNSSAGTGVATVIVSYTGNAYQLTSAEVTMQLTYQFPAQMTFSDMRVYAGEGENGQIAVAADLMPGTPSAASGAGVLTVPATQIDITNTQMVQAVKNMLLGPTNFSVDVDTVENPAAPLSGQLRGTDFMTFPIPGFAGSGAASEIDLHTLRQESGAVLAGTVIFDVNYRLAAGAQIAGMDIDGNVTAPAVSTDPSGSGNAYAVIGVDGGAGLTSLNGIVADPAAHQLEVLTPSAMSAPLAAANTALPVVAAVIPIVEVKNLSTFAPGELVEIYGTNLAQVTSDLSGWPGVSLPSALNGVSVTLGGQTGRILYVSPYQVDALLPFGVPTGSQMLTITTTNGASAPVSLNVAGIAPALYNFAFENVGFSLVSASNPASGGDTLVFYTTGMGQTTPALITGQTVPLGPPYFDTAPVTATIGGANANVIYSIAAPPYVTGLYQMAVTVPSGLPPGSQPVVATSGGIQSNSITIVTQ